MPSREVAVATVLLAVFAGCLGGQQPSDERAERALAEGQDTIETSRATVTTSRGP